MREENQLANKSEDDAEGENPLSRPYTRWVLGLVVGDLLAVIALGLVAYATTDSNTWATVISIGLVGIATVDAVILQVLIAGQMTLTMERQEFEMTEQRKTAQKQWQAMQDALDRTDTLIDQNKSIVRASERQARAADKTLKQTHTFFELVQRPILGIEKMYPTKDANGNVVVVGELVNRGKTVANVITQKVFSGIIDSNPAILQGDVPAPGKPFAATGPAFIHIGGVRELDFPALVPAAWNDINSGNAILLVWAEITYRGLTESEQYVLEMYSAWNLANKRFHGCPTHNRAT
ncbi:hypothetical protein BH10ACI2_BH10ACI2_23410 [soil metagenome]